MKLYFNSVYNGKITLIYLDPDDRCWYMCKPSEFDQFTGKVGPEYGRVKITSESAAQLFFHIKSFYRFTLSFTYELDDSVVLKNGLLNIGFRYALDGAELRKIESKIMYKYTGCDICLKHHVSVV